MAFLTIPNIKIKGISAGVPSKKIDNLNSELPLSDGYDNQTFVDQTGVRERRVDQLTTADLCFKAAEKLISDLNWDKSEISALIFVSQYFDFIAPATACIMQSKLGLPKECLAFDVELGCSGWIYGMSVISSLMRGGTIKKALLMAGDGRANYVGADKKAGALFGYAGTVTALEYDESADMMFTHLGSDGSGYEALMVKEGGARFPFNERSLEYTEVDGKQFCGLSSRMNGMDVFSFGISTAPKSIKKLMKEIGKESTDADYLILHQANKQMNDIIVKKLKFDPERVPESLSMFGNTSSASIPLTIVTNLKEALSKGKHSLLCCGFGIGLSWGSLFCNVEDLVIPDLVEVESHETML